MIVAAVSYLLFMPAVKLIVRMLSSTYAHSSVLYDICRKTLRVSFIFPKKFSGIKSRPKEKENTTRTKFTLFQAGLLALLAVFCLVEYGEARWFDDANEMIDNVNVEEVEMQVSVLFFVYT